MEPVTPPETPVPVTPPGFIPTPVPGAAPVPSPAPEPAPIPEPTQAPEPAPTTPAEPSPLKQIRTFQGDIADELKTKQTSVYALQQAEKERTEAREHLAPAIKV